MKWNIQIYKDFVKADDNVSQPAFLLKKVAKQSVSTYLFLFLMILGVKKLIVLPFWFPLCSKCHHFELHQHLVFAANHGILHSSITT
jgi:hypothetical protein